MMLKYLKAIACGKDKQCEKLVAAYQQNLDELLDYMTFLKIVWE